MAWKRFVAVLVLPLLAAACAGPVGERMKQGALIGAAAGALVGYGAGRSGPAAALGAGIGAAAGAAVGASVGVAEARAVYAEPQPLPWIQGKKVAVVGHPNYGYGVDVSRPVVEDQLRRRGAEIFNRPPYAREAAPVDYVVEVAAIEKSGAVIMDLRVIDSDARVVAIGSATEYFGAYGYGYTGDYRVEAVRTAAKNAAWALH